MLTGIHFILSYTCTYECDHCFLYCSPQSSGTFTIRQIDHVLEEALRLGSVTSVYFEGGEPLLYYPLLLEAVIRSKQAGFSVGIVTNSYLSQTEDDARLWLIPLANAGVDELSVSNDHFHSQDPADSPASITLSAATKLNMPVSAISIDRPSLKLDNSSGKPKGQPIIEGGTMFRGRAAERLTEGLPLKKTSTFIECPYEDLADPERVHLDAFGNVHICQGISLGNIWKVPFSQLIRQYDVNKHPICGPLQLGGPSRLAREMGIDDTREYVDECHCCFETRKSLLNIFPGVLTPKQVYGVD